MEDKTSGASSSTGGGGPSSSSARRTRSGKRRATAATMVMEGPSEVMMMEREEEEGENDEEKDHDDVDPDLLARLQSLLMASLRSAVVPSQLLTSHDTYHVSLINKEASIIVRQTVRSIGGGARVLAVLPQYPSTLNLSVKFFHYSEHDTSHSDEMMFSVPASIAPPNASVNLSNIRSLTVTLDYGLDPEVAGERGRGRRRRARDEKQQAKPWLLEEVTTLDDPLASIIIPGLCKNTLLTHLALNNQVRTLSPGFTSILTTRAAATLVSLTCTGGFQTANKFARIIWSAAEQDALPALQSLTIEGSSKNRNRAHDGLMDLLRGVAAKAHLRSLESLCIYGQLGHEQKDGSSPLRVIADENLDLSHLSKFCVNDRLALAVITSIFDENDPEKGHLQGLACTFICSILVGGFQSDFVKEVVMPTLPAVERTLLAASSPAVANVALRAYLEGKQFELWDRHWRHYDEIDRGVAEPIAQAITTSVNTHAAGHLPLVRYVIQWLGRDHKVSSAVLREMVLFNDYSEAVHHLLSYCAPEISREEGMDQQREEVLLFVLACFDVIDLPEEYEEALLGAIEPSDILDAVMVDALGKTSREILSLLIQQHPSLTSQINLRLCKVIKSMMDLDLWSVNDMMGTMGSSLCILLLDYQPSIISSQPTMVNMVVEELLRLPKRCTTNLITILDKWFPPSSKKNLEFLGPLASAACTPEHLVRFWNTVTTSACAFPLQWWTSHGSGLLAMLNEVKSRDVQVTFPPGLKPILGQLVEQHLVCDKREEAGADLDLSKWLVCREFGGPKHFIEGLIVAKRNSRKKSSRRTLMVGKTIAMNLLVAWWMVFDGGGEEEEDSHHHAIEDLLLSQTNVVFKICEMAIKTANKNEVVSWSHQINLPHLFWAAVEVVARHSQRFTEALYDERFLQAVISFYGERPDREVLLRIGTTMAHHEPQRFTLECFLAVERQRNSHIMHWLTAYLEALYEEPWKAFSAQHVAMVVDDATFNQSSISAEFRSSVGKQLVRRKGPLGRELAQLVVMKKVLPKRLRSGKTKG